MLLRSVLFLTLATAVPTCVSAEATKFVPVTVAMLDESIEDFSMHSDGKREITEDICPHASLEALIDLDRNSSAYIKKFDNGGLGARPGDVALFYRTYDLFSLSSILVWIVINETDGSCVAMISRN
jgi:hypothetical protein